MALRLYNTLVMSWVMIGLKVKTRLKVDCLGVLLDRATERVFNCFNVSCMFKV